MTTEERLEKLERELTRAKRRSRVMLVAAVMTVAGVFLLGAGGGEVQKVVRAETFALVDSAGTPRAMLSKTQDGSVGLALFDLNNVARIILDMNAEGSPELILNDQGSQGRFILGLDKSGQPGLTLIDQKATNRVALSLNESGQPMLGLADQSGKVRAALGVDQTVAPDGRSISYPESSLLLFGPDGKQIWSAP